MNMLSWSANQKEGEERYLFDKKYISLIENQSDLLALKFVDLTPNMYWDQFHLLINSINVDFKISWA